tara:strand:+ start:322 stop:594 length:273 start_codon:yes stop_codon:yes gene_type:complete
MYNQKIKSYIDKYRLLNQDSDRFKLKNKTWSRECYERMKNENSERYKNKKETNRIRYYISLKEKDSTKYRRALIRLQERDEELYNKLQNC